MKAPQFISRRIRFSSKAASLSIAVSFAVMIIAMAVDSGFRSEIYSSLSEAMGDVCVTAISSPEDVAPISGASYFAQKIEEVEGVSEARPVVCQAGIVKKGDDIQAVLFKGVESKSNPLQESAATQGSSQESAANSQAANALGISIPAKLANTLQIEVGDRVLAYFVAERTVLRSFTVESIYEGVAADADNLIVLCDIAMLRRVMAYGDDDASHIEVSLQKEMRGANEAEWVSGEISAMLYSLSDEDHSPLFATSLRQNYPQLFDWMDLIDFNVSFIIILMMVVAGFNMIGGLLIMLFQNISTIGMLKTMGMKNSKVAKTFLLSSGRNVLISLLCGNAAALLLCAVQHFTHVIKLNPESYFVSFVPVEIVPMAVIAVDVLDFVVIMLVQLIPCAFISRVEASKTVAYR